MTLLLTAVSWSRGASLAIEDYTIEPGGTQDITLVIGDGSISFAGFQADIITSDAMYVTAVRFADEFAYKDSYSLVSNLSNPNKASFMIVAKDFNDIPENISGPLLSISVSLSEDANSNTNLIKIDNLKVSDADGNEEDIDNKSDDWVGTISIPVSEIILDPAEAQIEITKSVQIKATVLPSDASFKTVSWRSSQPAIARVDNKGNVTGVAAGKAVITCEAEDESGVTATCNITVVPLGATDISITPPASLTDTGTATIYATVTPRGVTTAVVWTSSNPSVATVSCPRPTPNANTGVVDATVRGLKVGTTTITATCGSVSASYNLTVSKTAVTALEFSVSNINLKQGENAKLNPVITPANATYKTVTYTSAQPSVATVDANGVINALTVGTTEIIATCDGITASVTVTVSATQAESIVLNHTSLTFKATETAQLTAQVLPETTTDKTVIWTSSDESVATVDATGKVTALTVGSASITATCGDISATCEITVIATPAESVILNQSSLTLKSSETAQLTAEVLPETTTDKTVTWTSSDESVATVDATGKVTALAVGSAIITATCGEATAVCEITVIPTPADSIILNHTLLTLTTSETTQLTAQILPETTTDKTVTWTSSDETVAIVDESGKVTAVAAGNAVVTATCGEATASCEINVLQTEAEAIMLNAFILSLKVSEEAQLIASVIPSTATDKNVTWTSSDENVAAVDETGKITAVSVGKAVITATCGKATATCDIYVEATEAEEIVLNKTEVSLKVTETVQLTAEIHPETTTDKTITWASSNKAVATVDDNGMITAISLGKSTITATCGEIQAICEVTVTPTPAESITLNSKNLTLKATETAQLTAKIAPVTTTDKKVTWTTSDEAVATVNASGKVTAIAVGEAIITATCGNVQAICKVTVVETHAKSITLSSTTLKLKATETARLTATVLPATTTDKTIEWASSDEYVATVDENGLVIAVAVGEATITATCEDVQASCEVTVTETTAEKVEVKIDIPEIKVGESSKIEVEIYPATTTDKTVTITSSDPDVIKVDEDGNITAVGVGEATITVTCGDVTATTTITVLPTAAESIVLNQTSLTLKASETVQLTATVMPETTTDKTVTWISNNEAVATVDANGKITAVAVGTATITATCGEAQATCEVTVTETAAEKVEVKIDIPEIKVGESSKIEVEIYPATTTDKTVTITSSDPDVVKVDEDGNIFAVGVGEATITVTCGDVTATTTITVLPTAAESIVLNQTSLTLKASETAQLTAQVLPETTTDKTVTWTSSNEAVATVDVNGKITAVAVGTATITATCGNATATCEVTVVLTPAASITLSQTSLTLKASETAQLTAQVLPETTTDKTVTWTSSNEAVATVDANGKITAVAVGTAIITATCGNATATCEVTVVPTPAASITLNQTSLTLKASETAQLTAQVLPETTTDKTVTWTSSDTSVATVDATGKITAVAVGAAIITATCGEAKATCEITVTETAAEKVEVRIDIPEIKVGENAKIEVEIYPATTTDKTVTITSSNPDVVTVDEDGNIIAVGVGEATITVTCGDVTATTTITVLPTPAESIILNQTSLTLKASETAQLTATVMPETTTDKTVTWTSSNVAVATVDATGKITAVAIGKATITATCGKATVTCEVTVVPTPADSIILSQTSLTLKASETAQLTAEILPGTTTDKTVTWTSSNEAVATVDATGKVTAVAVGTTTITATCGRATATCNVTVAPTPVESVVISQNNATLKVGEKLRLTATVLPVNATDKTLTWRTSNAEVAIVDNDGNVTAIALGETVITASSGEITASCVITVEPTPAEEVLISAKSLELTIGRTTRLTATVVPDNTTDKTIVWRSTAENIATVDTEGNVTATGIGESIITATCGEATASCVVTVLPILATSLTIDITSREAVEGETFTITATVLPYDTTKPELAWSSSDESIAIVDQQGTVRLLKAGQCTITVRTTDGSNLSAECEVSVMTGLEAIIAAESDGTFDVYTYGGTLILRRGTVEDLRALAPGYYLINRHKIFKR